MITMKDRALGCLLGLAVGDAIGTTLEFRARGTFAPIADMVGGGPFNLKPGEWTDDTSMALCLGDSLIDDGGFSPDGQMRRYLSWCQNGTNSSNGRCFDIGMTVAGALGRYARGGDPMAGDKNPNKAGNGCIMRLAPVPIRYLSNPAKAVMYSGEQAATTHGAPECIQASRIFGEMLVRAMSGYSKQQILCESEHTKAVSSKLGAVVNGRSYAKKPRNAIRGSGYVVESLEAALWAFFTTETFRDCVLAAANLGDDADTTAAIAGQLAGAFYGIEGIPSEWVAKTVQAGRIMNMATCLLELAAADAQEDA